MNEIKQPTISAENYLWDSFTISEIADGKHHLQSPAHLDQLGHCPS